MHKPTNEKYSFTMYLCITTMPNYVRVHLPNIVLLLLPIGLDTVHVYVPMSLVLKLLIV